MNSDFVPENACTSCQGSGIERDEDCPHCKGSGIEPEKGEPVNMGLEKALKDLVADGRLKMVPIEPEVELISAKELAGDTIFGNAVNRVLAKKFIEEIQANARDYGEQEQRAKDVRICRKLAERKVKTLEELARYGNISNERRINQATSLFNEAANAIQQTKGEENETPDTTHNPGTSNS